MLAGFSDRLARKLGEQFEMCVDFLRQCRNCGYAPDLKEMPELATGLD